MPFPCGGLLIQWPSFRRRDRRLILSELWWPSAIDPASSTDEEATQAGHWSPGILECSIVVSSP